MRGRTIFLFVLALLLAGGTAMLVRSWLAHRATIVAAPRPVAPPTPQKSILIARTALERGQILKPGDVIWRAWPDTAIAADFIVALGEPRKSLDGWVVREPLAAGEPIVKTKIVAPGERGFLAAVLQPGMRAVSVAVDQTSDVSGFIFPGDRVDILISLSLPANGGNDSSSPRKAAATILHDVRVIAIDQRLNSKDGQAVVARTVTLEVTPKESEILALATDMSGKLSLSLRSLVNPPHHTPGVIAFAGSPTGIASDQPADTVAADPEPSVDSIDGHASRSFTLEGEVSPVLRKPLAKHNLNGDKVCILRGSSNSAHGCESQPGS